MRQTHRQQKKRGSGLKMRRINAEQRCLDAVTRALEPYKRGCAWRPQTHISRGLRQWRSAHATRSVRFMAPRWWMGWRRLSSRADIGRTSTLFRIWFVFNWVFEQNQATELLYVWGWMWKCVNSIECTLDYRLVFTYFVLIFLIWAYMSSACSFTSL